MSAYRTWEDLDERAPAHAPPGGAEADRRSPLAAQLDDLGISEELAALLRKKEDLESVLRGFGRGDQEPGDERRRKCFPVKAHTKETRIEERRLRLRDEQLAALAKRRIERARLERCWAENEELARLRQIASARLARLEAEQRLRAERAALEKQQLAKRREAEYAREREQSRQEAARLRLAADLLAERAAERAAEEARRRAEREEQIAKWAQERAVALQCARQIQEQDAAALDQANEARRAALLRARQEQERHRAALEQSDELRRAALNRQLARLRMARAQSESSEAARRSLERRVRANCVAANRAEQGRFEERREEAARAAQVRRIAMRRANEAV
jgi:hypothetical protein